MGANIYTVFNETEEPLGIYSAEGTEKRSGSFLQQWFHRRPQTALAVICRGTGARRDERAVRASMGEVIRLLTAFEQWFGREFPRNMHPFSADVVKRYWQSMIGQVLETGRPPIDVAVLLVHAGQYVFCSRGSFSVYEVTASGQRCCRWFTGMERRQLDEELGIAQGEMSELQFRHRKIEKKTVFILSLKEIFWQKGVCAGKWSFSESRFRKAVERMEECTCCVAVAADVADGSV